MRECAYARRFQSSQQRAEALPRRQPALLTPLANDSETRRSEPGSATGCDRWRGAAAGRGSPPAATAVAETCGNPGKPRAVVSRETYTCASDRTIPAGDSLQQWMMRRTIAGPRTDHPRGSAATAVDGEAILPGLQ